MDRSRIRLHYPNMTVIPIYALYGESESTTDWLHAESIQARSRLHGYRIEPHRHEQLLQVLILQTGTGELTLDGTEHTLAPTTAVIVPALTVHGYRFSTDVDGLVLTMREEEMRSTGLPLPTAMVLCDPPQSLTSAARRLIDEAKNRGVAHDTAMRALFALLAVEIQRARQVMVQSRSPDRALALTQAFRQLIEDRFRETRRIEDYAAAVGISPTHLNRVCRQVAGASALGLIERRIALEARRMLLFSTLSIKQIGGELGYDDPAYFSRFLTRVLGKPPGMFRRERG